MRAAVSAFMGQGVDRSGQMDYRMGRRALRILVFCSSYPPADRGGTVRAVEGIVDHLGREHDFHILARDREGRAAGRYLGIRADEWQRRGDAMVYYASPRSLRPHRMGSLARAVNAGAYYVNSFVSPAFGSTPVLLRWLGAIPRRPMIIAPRGELHPAALRHKQLKKMAFVRVARALPAYRDLIWQAGGVVEVEQIRTHFPSAQVVVARDLAHLDTTMGRGSRAKRKGELSIAYLSRITPLKNLAFAIQMVSQLEGDVQFNVYGPDVEAPYAQHCRRQAKRAPANIRIDFRGEVPHDAVLDTLSRHHVFLLPTMGESFGHAILEALIAGCVLVISDQTPWSELRESSAGWALPLADQAGFVQALQTCVAMGEEEFAERAAESQRVGTLAANSPDALAQSRAMFEAARQQ